MRLAMCLAANQAAVAFVYILLRRKVVGSKVTEEARGSTDGKVIF
jgi:hypothetical protein